VTSGTKQQRKRLAAMQIRGLFLAIALPVMLGTRPLAAPDAKVAVTKATIAAPYSRFCAALRKGNQYFLNPTLFSNFRATDVTGKIENRSEYVDTLISIDPSRITHCAFDVKSYKNRGNEFQVKAVWTLRGKASPASNAQQLTYVSRVQDLWLSTATGWRLLRRLTLTSNQWDDGWPEMRQTYAARLSLTQKAAVVADIRREAHPLLSAYPQTRDDDLQPILRAVRNSRIVAMGEGSHGTSEFFALKDRVFRYLVEHDDVRVFAQETDWAAGQDIEAYLQTGRGNLADLLANTFVTWNNQETLDLLQWMRAYNIVHAGALHFFGIDMQEPQQAAQLLIAFYTRYDTADAARIAADLACINQPLMKLVHRAQPLSRSCVTSTQRAFALTAHNSSLQTATSRGTYMSAYHAADIARQAALEYTQSNILNRVVPAIGEWPITCTGYSLRNIQTARLLFGLITGTSGSALRHGHQWVRTSDERSGAIILR
jgi:Erythromycin esterase